jgi:CubicO group peptidase (beta-lactamase class C family)
MNADGQLRAWLDALASLGGVVSALEAVVATADAELFRHAAGFRVGGARLEPASGARFDAASLSKPWMATLALALDRSGRLPLGERLPAAVAAPHSSPSTLEDLLRHRAGLRAWTPLAVRLGRRLGDREAVIGLLGSERSPRGGATYSDLGYLLWGLLAERHSGERLPALLDREVCSPLGVAPLGALVTAAEIADAVECRLDNGKEVELASEEGIALARQRPHLRGVVQDGNARALRAVGIDAAHAGLFVTADEMLALAREWLRPARLLAPAQVERALAGDGPYALGWARQSDDGSSGPALSRRAFGHTGFTGSSCWIDPASGRIVILLAHRLSSRVDFNPFRRELHRLAAEL